MQDEELFDLNRNKVNVQSSNEEKEFVSNLVKDYIDYKTRRRRNSSCSSSTSLILRRVSEELEDSNKEFFNDVCQRLEMHDSDAELKFKVVSEDVLKDKVSWGRLVSLFVFSGKIAEWLQQQRSSEKIDEVCDWLTDSICRQQGWIDENGGWAAFDEKFEEISPFSSSLFTKGLAVASSLCIAALIIAKLKGR